MTPSLSPRLDSAPQEPPPVRTAPQHRPARARSAAACRAHTTRVLTGRRSPQARVRLTPRAAPPHLPARATERHLGPRLEVAFEAEHLRRLSHLRGPAGGGAAGGGPGGLGGARQGRGLAVRRRPACGSALSALPAGASAATLEAGLSAPLPPRRATAERGAPRLAPAPRCRRNQDGDRPHCARARAAVRTCAARSSTVRRSSRQPPRARAPALAISSAALFPAASGLACVRGSAGRGANHPSVRASRRRPSPPSDNDGVAHAPGD